GEMSGQTALHSHAVVLEVPADALGDDPVRVRGGRAAPTGDAVGGHHVRTSRRASRRVMATRTSAPLAASRAGRTRSRSGASSPPRCDVHHGMYEPPFTCRTCPVVAFASS